jgi:hypothetical protein
LSVSVEFRRHKKADNPIHIMGFLIEWKKYLDGLRAGDLTKGKPLEMEKLEKVRLPILVVGRFIGGHWERKKANHADVNSLPSSFSFQKMSNEQVAQLYELMHATKEIWKS